MCRITIACLVVLLSVPMGAQAAPGAFAATGLQISKKDPRASTLDKFERMANAVSRRGHVGVLSAKGILIDIGLDGKINWLVSIADGKEIEAVDIAPYGDGGYAVIGTERGTTKSGRGDVPFIVRVDEKGAIVGKRILSSEGELKNIWATEDGGYLMVGGYVFEGSRYDIGIWYKRGAGYCYKENLPKGEKEHTAPSWINGQRFIYIMKTNVDGELEWEQIAGTGGAEKEEIYSAVEVEDGYLLSGRRSCRGGCGKLTSAAYLLKVKKDGVFAWSSRPKTLLPAMQLIAMKQEVFFVTENHGYPQVLKVDQDGNTQLVAQLETKAKRGVKISAVGTPGGLLLILCVDQYGHEIMTLDGKGRVKSVARYEKYKVKSKKPLDVMSELFLVNGKVFGIGGKYSAEIYLSRIGM